MDEREREIESMRVELSELHVVLDEIQDELRASGGPRSGEQTRSERAVQLMGWEARPIAVTILQGEKRPWTLPMAGACAWCRHGMWSKTTQWAVASAGDSIWVEGAPVIAQGGELLPIPDVPTCRCLVSHQNLTETVAECSHQEDLDGDDMTG